MTKPQLHVSMLNMMSRCGIQFQRRYGARFGVWHEEEIIPPGVALVVGISTHKSVEQNLSNKIKSGELLPDEHVQQIARDSLEGLWQAGILLTEEEAADIRKTKLACIDLTVALSSLHHQELAPDLSPLAVEERFVIALKRYPYDLSGTIDIREANVIRDTKTMGKTPPENAAYSMQLAMYSLAHKVHHGTLPVAVYLDALVKTKVPKIQTRGAIPEIKWIDPLLRRVERATEIIEAVQSGKEAFAPAQPDDWQCTRRYCGYADSCKFWSGRE